MIVLLILAASLFNGPAPIQVDIIEANQVISHETGLTALSQVVLWDWEKHGDVADYYVRAWKFSGKCSPIERIRGKWFCRFDGTLVVSEMYIETRSWVDHEVEDRKRLPAEQRSWKR